MPFGQHELREREDTERVPPARRRCRRVAAVGARAFFTASVLSLLACASAGSNDASHGDDASAGDASAGDASAGDATIGDAVAAADAARNDAAPNDGAVDGPFVEGASPDGEATGAGDAASDVAPPASMDGSSEADASCIVDVPCDLGVPCHTGTTSCAGGQAACVDGGVLAAGTSCGDPATGQVCNASGSCGCGYQEHLCNQKCVNSGSTSSCGSSCTACPLPQGATSTNCTSRNLAEPYECGFLCGTSKCNGTADTCAAGACHCGSGPPCGSGLSCVAGACQCLPQICVNAVLGLSSCCAVGGPPACLDPSAQTPASCNGGVGSAAGQCGVCPTNNPTCSRTIGCSCGGHVCGANQNCTGGACG